VPKKFVKTHTRSKNTSCKVNNYFMFAICFTQTKLTSINCNDEINNQSFQTYIVQVSVSEPPICIFITRELVTRMTSEAYVYIVDTVDSSSYKAMSQQLSVNVSILYVIKHL
jgi:hypothetical protein